MSFNGPVSHDSERNSIKTIVGRRRGEGGGGEKALRLRRRLHHACANTPLIVVRLQMAAPSSIDNTIASQQQFTNCFFLSVLHCVVYLHSSFEQIQRHEVLRLLIEFCWIAKHWSAKVYWVGSMFYKGYIIIATNQQIQRHDILRLLIEFSWMAKHWSKVHAVRTMFYKGYIIIATNQQIQRHDIFRLLIELMSFALIERIWSTQHVL